MKLPGPYLAMGFMPVSTSGAENMCRLNSLITSLLAAIKALNLTGVDPRLITMGNFKEWLKGPEYMAKVNAVLHRIYPPDEVGKYERSNPDWKNQPGGYNGQEEEPS